MRTLLAVLLTGLLSPVLSAQSADIPLSNWTVPPYRSSGITTMTDVTGPRLFIGVQPCRLVDTRQAGFPAGYGTPALAGGVPRNFDLNSDPQCPGIPGPSGTSFGVTAYSLNITVTNTQGPGFIKIYPQGGSVPVDVSTLNYVGGQSVANAAIVPAGSGGGITVVAGVSGTDLIIDINGYFSDAGNNLQGSLFLSNSSSVQTADFRNSSSSCNDACGLYAQAFSAGPGKAIWGQMFTGSNNSAGVLGIQGGPSVTSIGFPGAGVRGESPNLGVVGIARVVGTAGTLVAAGGAFLVEGYLGYDPGTATKYGVWSTANYGGGGAKFFVEPHPTDASKVIRYISLEGPEPGTYFRGRGKFERGIARIAVREDFRMVTDADGLTVQITPIGAMASFAVLKADLNEIVVQCSRNVEFYYLVQGIRRTHKHLTSPIGEGGEYMPKSADATMPPSLTEAQKQLLIQNGTYRADGTVNMETAHRFGWDRVWAERSGMPAPALPPQ